MGRRLAGVLRAALWAVGMAALVLAPAWVSNSYALNLIETAALNVMLALSLNLLYGFAGQISFGHAAFYGLGAYLAAILEVKAHVPFLASALIASALTFVLAGVGGYPILRLQGHYLGMATLSLGLLVETVANQWIRVTGGPDGIGLDPPALLGVPLGQGGVYALIVLGAIFTYLFCASLARSNFGLALQAIRGDEAAARSLGIDAARYKSMALALSGGIAAAAGVLYAHQNLYLTPEVAGLNQSVRVLIMVVVGGLGSNGGALLGALLFTVLPELLQSFQDYHLLVYGLLLLGSLAFVPRGLVGFIDRGGAGLSMARVGVTDAATPGGEGGASGRDASGSEPAIIPVLDRRDSA